MSLVVLVAIAALWHAALRDERERTGAYTYRRRFRAPLP